MELAAIYNARMAAGDFTPGELGEMERSGIRARTDHLKDNPSATQSELDQVVAEAMIKASGGLLTDRSMLIAGDEAFDSEGRTLEDLAAAGSKVANVNAFLHAYHMNQFADGQPLMLDIKMVGDNGENIDVIAQINERGIGPDPATDGYLVTAATTNPSNSFRKQYTFGATLINRDNAFTRVFRYGPDHGGGVSDITHG